jgi:hypothetical protein
MWEASSNSMESEMTFRGRVQNGVVVFDGPQKPLEGAAVEVAVLTNGAKESLRDFLLEFAGTIEGLPSDMAAQHDHYIHGRPKR